MTGIAAHGARQADVAFTEPSAWSCPTATHYLKWGPIGGTRQGWTLTSNTGRVVATLDGYPVGKPAVTADQARTWASKHLGADTVWTERPARSQAFHTHPGGYPYCSEAVTTARIYDADTPDGRDGTDTEITAALAGMGTALDGTSYLDIWRQSQNDDDE